MAADKIPVPANPTVRVGFDALELRERFPLTPPLDGGVNLTVNVVLWPALRLMGRLRPVRPNPAPATVAWETVRLVPPELVNV